MQGSRLRLEKGFLKHYIKNRPDPKTIGYSATRTHTSRHIYLDKRLEDYSLKKPNRPSFVDVDS